MVDVLGAVVGMEAENAERKAGEQGFDHRQQIGFADLLAGSDELPLGQAIHGIDVINTFHPVLVALMHAVDADEAGPPLGRGRATLADADRVARVLVHSRRRSV